MLKGLVVLVAIVAGLWLAVVLLETNADVPVSSPPSQVSLGGSPLSYPQAASYPAAPAASVPPARVATAPAVKPVVAPRPAPRSELSLEAPSEAKVGETVRVRVNASVPDGASTFSFMVRFDPRVWKFVQATQGNFMTEANAIAELRTDLEPLTGTVTVTVEQDGGPPVAGAGSLVVFELEALARSPAPSRIAISKVSVAAFDRGELPSIGSADAAIRVLQ